MGAMTERRPRLSLSSVVERQMSGGVGGVGDISVSPILAPEKKPTRLSFTDLVQQQMGATSGRVVGHVQSLSPLREKSIEDVSREFSEALNTSDHGSRREASASPERVTSPRAITAMPNVMRAMKGWGQKK